MSGFASERCPASPGTASGIASEYPSGFNRISHKATLVIAKLDRLSRNVAFIANLMESKVLAAVVEHDLGPNLFRVAGAECQGRAWVSWKYCGVCTTR
jgi:hypothetical protein